MKKIQSVQLSLFLFTLLTLTNCRKETTEVTPLKEESSEQSMERGSNHGRDCRLTMYNFYDAVHDYSQIDYFSYKKGKVDEWLASYGSLFKMEYDNDDRLKIAKMYDAEVLINTIKFIYRNNRVFKEIWYEGNTNVVADQVIYAYNRKGEMIRNESMTYDYYVTYTYTNEGNLKSWFYYSGGLPSQKAEYTYRSEFKNPLEARPGIPYSFPYINAGFGAGKNWYSSEKSTLYDEDGNPSVYYDEDPRLTTWERGPKNYPAKASHVDRISGGSITEMFEYENCHGHHDDSQTGSLNQKMEKNKNNRSGRIGKILLH